MLRVANDAPLSMTIHLLALRGKQIAHSEKAELDTLEDDGGEVVHLLSAA